MINKNQFRKKIFTFRLLIHDILYLLFNIKTIVFAVRNKRLSKIFIEKIMTVVTAVNGCTYCTWFHTKQAVASGITEAEVTNMLNLQFKSDASTFEVPALLYAQHFAETDRNPNSEMTKMLIDFYGDALSKQINLIIRIIYFGNLTGNTFDAFLSRLKGEKAENSNLIFETLFFIINAPILLPLIPVTKKHRIIN